MSGGRAVRAKLASERLVVVDGATSTELQRRGVPMDIVTWSAVANLEQPEVVQAIHEDYIRAGAEVITANTYSTGPAALRPAGLMDDFETINRRAVEIAMRARDAADSQVAIAGSVSSFCTLGVEGFPVLRTSAADIFTQAELLAASGVDLIAMEMIDAPDYGPDAVDAVLSTGLPVWLGMSPVRCDDGSLGTFEEPGGFEDLVKAVVRPELTAVVLMHVKPDVVPDGLVILGRYTDVPLGAYAETGDWTCPNWVFDGMDPAEYAAAALAWVDAGIRVIGGCCGTGPEHIAQLVAMLNARGDAGSAEEGRG